MSLIISNSLLMPMNKGDEDQAEDQLALNRLDRYINIAESNRKAASFVPDDLTVALDMAGFVRRRLAGKQNGSVISIARLALSLIQSPPEAPMQ